MRKPQKEKLCARGECKLNEMDVYAFTETFCEILLVLKLFHSLDSN